MNTLSENQGIFQSKKHEAAHVGLGRRIGFFFLAAFGGLLILVSMLPVIFLPFITAVPLLLCLLLLLVDGGLLWLLFIRAGTTMMKIGIIVGIMLVSLLAVLLSQWYATTPAILGTDGEPLAGSIAELERVELNGREQWITIRGQDPGKPVLLFLAGGPGGSQLAATRSKLGALEEHFVVVNWDQPGAGKSYQAADFEKLTPEQYIADAHELTLYLHAEIWRGKDLSVG